MKGTEGTATLDRGTVQHHALAALYLGKCLGRRQSRYGGFAEKKNLLTLQVMSLCFRCFTCTVDQTVPGPYITVREFSVNRFYLSFC
jgi:hypothetical protein